METFQITQRLYLANTLTPEEAEAEARRYLAITGLVGAFVIHRGRTTRVERGEE